MGDLLGETISLNVGNNGSFSAAGSTGCNFSGTLTPRASGKNVFDVALTFGGALEPRRSAIAERYAGPKGRS